MSNTKVTPSDFEAEARGILVRYGVKVIERGAGTPMNEEIAVAVSALTHLHQQEMLKQYKKVNRFEVIDETSRAYVKGSIYGTPVSVDLSLQDDDRTLKVFVTNLSNSKEKS